MSPRYLLPCSCGRKVAVGTAQAGQTVRCECGSPVEVPRLRELSQREQEPASSPDARAAQFRWRLRQQVAVVGVAITVVAIGLAVYLYAVRPVPPTRQVDRDLIRHQVEDLGLLQTMELWDVLRGGLDRSTRPEDNDYAEAVRVHDYRKGVIAAVAVLGLAVLAVAWFLPSRKQTDG